jgi:hypothetical protein
VVDAPLPPGAELIDDSLDCINRTSCPTTYSACFEDCCNGALFTLSGIPSNFVLYLDYIYSITGSGGSVQKCAKFVSFRPCGSTTYTYTSIEMVGPDPESDCVKCIEATPNVCPTTTTTTSTTSTTSTTTTTTLPCSCYEVTSSDPLDSIDYSFENCSTGNTEFGLVEPLDTVYLCAVTGSLIALKPGLTITLIGICGSTCPPPP